MRLRPLLLSLAVLVPAAGVVWLVQRPAPVATSDDARLGQHVADPAVIATAARVRIKTGVKTLELIRGEGERWTIAGQQIRAATATKNMLAMAMNASATLIFAFSGMISWAAAISLCAGGIAGGLLGSWLIYRLPPQLMRIFVVMVGAVLTVYMFLR